jgi:hypothetical protein
MNRAQAPLHSLVGALRELLESAGPEAAPFLRDWPHELIARPVGQSALPVVGALKDLARFAAPETRALTESVAALAHAFAWRQTYGADDFGPRFLDAYGYCEWIGERGAFESRKIACGVLLLGPDTDYPAHAHEAEEIYLPLAGRAWWLKGTSDWTLRPPGRLIHHPSWTSHAMRTGDEPLLAAYVWRGGDLSAKSRIEDRQMKANMRRSRHCAHNESEVNPHPAASAATLSRPRAGGVHPDAGLSCNSDRRRKARAASSVIQSRRRTLVHTTARTAGCFGLWASVLPCVPCICGGA